MTEKTKQCLKIGVYGLAAIGNLALSWFLGSRLGQAVGELIISNDN